MNFRKLAYSLAIAMLSYDVLSTMKASKLYGRFGDLNSIANFLGQKNPVFVCVVMLILILGWIYFFSLTLSIKSKGIGARIPITVCDFFAAYMIIFEVIAIPHNTLVLFGSYGIVPSSKMFLIQEIASALIAGVIVVIVDWKRLLGRVSNQEN